MDRLAQYFRATKAEMKHVKWPTQRQGITYTFLVIGVSAVVMIFVALADFVFTSGVDFIVNTF
jgi:preprotein translocase SecE subunit